MGAEDFTAEKCGGEDRSWPTLNLEKQLYLKGVQAKGGAQGRLGKPGVCRGHGAHGKSSQEGTVVPGPSAAGKGWYEVRIEKCPRV